MSWEWISSSQERQWSLTVGEWQAVVRRVDGPRYLWGAAIEQPGASDDRYDGPTTADALEARTWCLTKIAELRINDGPGT
jgi:hypothetical protein